MERSFLVRKQSHDYRYEVSLQSISAMWQSGMPNRNLLVL